jgi:hypothetical protein
VSREHELQWGCEVISGADQSIVEHNNRYSASYAGLPGSYLGSNATTPVVTLF